MNRKEILLSGITKDQFGLEIGAYHSPLVPKMDGYNSIVLDLFNQTELRERARSTPGVPSECIDRIEQVDIIGSAIFLKDALIKNKLYGKLDYIISSHNFEHIPDPIRFLQASESGLKPGGHLIMAIPDRRFCFDYFRPNSTTADFLSAYSEKRIRPSPNQIFSHLSLNSFFQREGKRSFGFSVIDDPSQIIPSEDIAYAYQNWRYAIENPEEFYPDIHCWTFTPSSFEMIIQDLWFLDLIKLQILDIQSHGEFEFYAKLAVCPSIDQIDKRGYYERRANLMRAINNEGYDNTIRAYQMRGELEAAYAREAANTAQLRASFTEMQRRLNALENSTSWKLTAPIRSVMRWLRSKSLRG
jgi:SAM-dependent methyltransferase